MPGFKKLFIGALLVLLCETRGKAFACPAAEFNVHWRVAQEYLSNVKNVQDDRCVSAALIRLSLPDAKPDPSLLVRYLGFLKPDLQGFLSLQNDNVGELFPAVRALVVTGYPSLSPLIEVLRRPNRDYAIRRNAGRAVRLIYEGRGELAVERIMIAANHEVGPAKELLEEAAFWMYEWCSDKERDACNVAYRKYRDGTNSHK